MANANKPRGFQPYGQVLRQQIYVAGGNIYPGDLVVLNSSGEVAVAAADGTSETGAVLGVAVSKAASGDDVAVLDHPEQMFVAQAHGSTIAAQTNLNLNYPYLANAPDTTYNKSKQEIDDSAGATTATLPIKVLYIDKAIDNALGANVRCVVKLNNHQLAGGTGTAGV